MPGWLVWALAALAAWCGISIVVALLLGQVFGRGREERKRVLVLVGPTSIRVRGRGLKKAS